MYPATNITITNLYSTINLLSACDHKRPFVSILVQSRYIEGDEGKRKVLRWKIAKVKYLREPMQPLSIASPQHFRFLLTHLNFTRFLNYHTMRALLATLHEEEIIFCVTSEGKNTYIKFKGFGKKTWRFVCVCRYFFLLFRFFVGERQI